MVSRRPLLYREGADRALDRPAHVRAGSGLSWLEDRLVLVQDDANFIAVIDPTTGLADAITLPAGEGGVRQFDDGRGNKAFKLDLEACCVVAGAEGPMLLALGSGSSERRRRVAIMDRWEQATPRVRLVDASALYLALEHASEFSGSEMNIEGALALPGMVRLVGRGNGKARGGLEARNATCDLPLDALLAYLDKGMQAPAPRAIQQFSLGTHDGLALGFTDVAQLNDAIIYTATAEASPSATEDGRVSGSVLGIMPSSGDLRHAPIADADGGMLRHKVEGVVPMSGARDRVYIVIDSDDAMQPSELCEVQLNGAWA